MSSLSVETVLYAREAGQPKIMAKHYVASATSDPNGLTLVLLHGVGHCKETWEPMIEALLSPQCGADAHSGILDVWSIEDPEHGQSGVMNEGLWSSSDYDSMSYDVEEYTKIVLAFLSAGPNEGAKVDFSQRKLVGIAHSLGACSLIMLPRAKPRVCFQSIILIEASAGRDSPMRRKTVGTLHSLCWTKRDNWQNPEAAEKFHKDHPVFGKWPAQSLKIHLQYTLRPHPASKYPPPFNHPGVICVLPRSREAMRMRYSVEAIDIVLNELGIISEMLPVHLIFAKVNDLGHPSFKYDQIEMTKGKVASVSWIEGVGHNVAQQAPEELAKVIYGTLRSKASL